MTSLTRNDYEPDVCFFGNEKASHFKKNQLHYPIPDFVAEVLSTSSEKMMEHDRKTKYGDYEQHGISEYRIIDPEEEKVAQYVLANGKFSRLLKAAEGIIDCRAVKVFSIPIQAIFDKKLNRGALRTMLD